MASHSKWISEMRSDLREIKEMLQALVEKGNGGGAYARVFIPAAATGCSTDIIPSAPMDTTAPPTTSPLTLTEVDMHAASACLGVSADLELLPQDASNLFDKMSGTNCSEFSIIPILKDSCISSMGLHESSKVSEGANGSAICDPNISVKEIAHVFDELQQPENVNANAIHKSDIPVQHAPYACGEMLELAEHKDVCEGVKIRVPCSDQFFQGIHTVFDEMPNKDNISVHVVHELNSDSLDWVTPDVREGIGDACSMHDEMLPWRRSAFSPGNSGLEGVCMAYVEVPQAKSMCVNRSWVNGRLHMVIPSSNQFACQSLILFKSNQMAYQAVREVYLDSSCCRSGFHFARSVWLQGLFAATTTTTTKPFCPKQGLFAAQCENHLRPSLPWDPSDQVNATGLEKLVWFSEYNVCILLLLVEQLEKIPIRSLSFEQLDYKQDCTLTDMTWDKSLNRSVEILLCTLGWHLRICEEFKENTYPSVYCSDWEILFDHGHLFLKHWCLCAPLCWESTITNEVFCSSGLGAPMYKPAPRVGKYSLEHLHHVSDHLVEYLFASANQIGEAGILDYIMNTQIQKACTVL